MTSNEIKAIKERIEQTLSKRFGLGAVNGFFSEDNAFLEAKDGDILTSEVGEKTIDLLLKITGRDKDREDFPELGTGSYQGGVIPDAFNVDDINRICNELDADVENRGGFKGYINGVYYDLPGGMDKSAGDDNQTERNHCGGACSGLCMGSCIGMCNGCTGCYGTCNSSCTGSSEKDVNEEIE